LKNKPPGTNNKKNSASRKGKGKAINTNGTKHGKYDNILECAIIQSFKYDLITGLEAAFEKLKQYYTRTDLSNVYTLAVALDPTLKYSYWEKEGWGVGDDSYLESAKAMVEDEYHRCRDLAGVENQEDEESHSEEETTDDDGQQQITYITDDEEDLQYAARISVPP
jgi:hypothetical protein